MRKFAHHPETEKEPAVSPLREIANDDENLITESAAAFRAANDNDAFSTGKPFSVPEAANDEVGAAEENPLQAADEVRLSEVRERLLANSEVGHVLESTPLEPTPQIEALTVSAESTAEDQGATNGAAGRTTAQPAAAAPASPRGGAPVGGGNSSKGGVTTSTKKSGGKLWGFLKGVGNFLGFIALVPFVAAFKLMHYGTDKIMSFAGAEGVKKGGKK